MKKIHYCCNEGIYELRDDEGNKYDLIIKNDDDSEDPRSWDNTSTIWCWHRNYKIGDKIPNNMDFYEAFGFLCDKYNIQCDIYEESTIELFRKLQEYEDIVILPINAYEHGNITISTSSRYPYNCPWDGGLIGFAFIDKETVFEQFLSITEENWKEKAIECIEAEIKILDFWLQGEVYGFELGKETHKIEEKRCPHCNEIYETKEYDDFEIIDTCFGFYGDTIEENGIRHEIPEYLHFVDEEE